MTVLSWNIFFDKKKKKKKKKKKNINKTICDFATRRFRTLPGSLTSINSPTSIATASRP